MDQIVAIVALVKILACVLLIVTLLYAIAVESDAKRKLIELVTFFAIFAVLMGIQFIAPKMAGPNSQKFKDACQAWDPSPLFATN